MHLLLQHVFKFIVERKEVKRKEKEKKSWNKIASRNVPLLTRKKENVKENKRLSKMQFTEW